MCQAIAALCEEAPEIVLEPLLALFQAGALEPDVAREVVVERLSGLPNARKTTIVKEEQGKVCARVYPKSATQNGELARQVLAAGSGWQLEEVRTDEGRLDEVFRSITLPDTSKEGAK